jgi:hypothetical protein
MVIELKEPDNLKKPEKNHKNQRYVASFSRQIRVEMDCRTAIRQNYVIMILII